MTVLDASVLVELVLQTATGRAVADRIADPELRLDAPHLVDVEVAQTLRRYVREANIDVTEAGVALTDLSALDLRRHAHEPLLDRVWELRENLSAYDAVYVALAEALETTLLTCDARLAKAPGLRNVVELVVTD
jgi:predicted nucleic acid-binding protein